MTQILESIAEKMRSGQLEEARQALNDLDTTSDDPGEALFLRGCIHQASYEYEPALEAFQKVLDLHPDHLEAKFRAAFLYDQAGEDDAAIALYEQCMAQDAVPVHVLINLSVLYEEKGMLQEAQSCLEAILAEYPNHRRAQDYLKSVKSSYHMVYDERKRRESEQKNALLDQSINDFELSVRSRNCLRQMNIRTMGDLLKVTEQELLSYKNFGETSLNEIKAMLSQKTLYLGQLLAPSSPQSPLPLPSAPTNPGANPIMLSHPVSALELSVRSRKCLQWLGITSIEELIMRSEAELMAIKNFGQTSLLEIKRELARHGFFFRGSS